MERVQRAAQALGFSVQGSHGLGLRTIVVGALALASIGLNVPTASAVSLTQSSVSLSDPRPGAGGVTYSFTGSSVTASAIYCIKVIVATTSTGTTAPTGFSGTGASITAASSTLVNSSASGWSLALSDGTASTGQKNILQYTNASGVLPLTLSGVTYAVSGLANASTGATAYSFRLSTYGNTDCVSSPLDTANLQFINTDGSAVSLTVDPSLSFTIATVLSGQSCAGGTTDQGSTPTAINFGGVTTAAPRLVCQDLTAATNAPNGYTVYIRDTGQPTNGAATIPDAPGSNASPAAFPATGTAAYGYSTDDATLGTGTANRFTSPTVEWAANTNTNAEIGYEPAGGGSATFRIAHKVGIASTTASGAYQTTVIYTCTPVY